MQSVQERASVSDMRRKCRQPDMCIAGVARQLDHLRIRCSHRYKIGNVSGFGTAMAMSEGVAEYQMFGLSVATQALWMQWRCVVSGDVNLDISSDGDVPPSGQLAGMTVCCTHMCIAKTKCKMLS